MDIQVTISKTDRWHYIDLIESIAILFVIIYHSTTYSFSWMENSSALFYIRYYLRTILSTCVPLFFFANGYLMLNRSFDLKKHIIKIVKIIVLTLIWSIITLILLMPPIKNEYLSVRELVVYLQHGKGAINHLWYMGALVCIYIFFPLLKISFDNYRKAFIYFVIICAIMTFGKTFICNYGSIVLNKFGVHEGIINANCFNMFNPFRGIRGYSFVYFCIGGLAHDFVNKLQDISQKKISTIAMLTIALSCFGLFMTGIALSNISGKMWDVVWSGYDTIFTLVNVCMIFVLSVFYRGNSKIIRLISINTLGIYFIHAIIINFTMEFMKTIPFVQSFIGCIVYSLLIMFICLILTQILIRIPIVKKLIKL